MTELFTMKARLAYAVREQRKQLEKEEDALFLELKKITDNKEFKAGGYHLICETRKGNIEYGKVKELQGVDLEPYRKPEGKTWKLSLYQLEP